MWTLIICCCKQDTVHCYLGWHSWLVHNFIISNQIIENRAVADYQNNWLYLAKQHCRLCRLYRRDKYWQCKTFAGKHTHIWLILYIWIWSLVFLYTCSSGDEISSPSEVYLPSHPLQVETRWHIGCQVSHYGSNTTGKMTELLYSSWKYSTRPHLDLHLVPSPCNVFNGSVVVLWKWCIQYSTFVSLFV